MSYTQQQYLSALNSAKAAGDTAAVEAIRGALVEQQEAADREAYDPSKGGGSILGIPTSEGVERVRAGIGRGLTNVVRQVGNIAGVNSDEELERANEIDAPLMNTTGGKVGNFVGEIAATAPIAAGGVGVAGRLFSGAAKALANPIARGAAEGAIQGSITAGPGNRGAGAATGAAFGSALPLVGKAVGTAARGLTRTPGAQKLLDEGVELTPGQMNPGGVINQVEEAWQSVPLVGSVIKGARDNAQEGFQAAAARKATAPGGTVRPADPASMLDDAYKSFEPLYDAARGFPVAPKIVRTAGGDIPLTQALAQAAASKGVRATDQQRKAVNVYLQDQATRLNGTSDSLLEMRSVIRAEARKARGTQGDTASAELLDQADEAIGNVLESQLPKEAIKALATADSKYGTYKVLEDAVARAKSKPGGFTANDLAEAVAGANKGSLKGNYARGGGGELRELAEAGTQALNVRSPATGARLAAIGLPLAGATANPLAALPVAALLGAAGTKTGRALAAGKTTPQKIAQALLERGNQSLSDPTKQVLAQYLRRLSVAPAIREE